MSAARIVRRGELVVAMFRVDSAPFFVGRNGVLSGTGVDLARLIGRELGVPVRFGLRRILLGAP